jgi:hypothetical protein
LTLLRDAIEIPSPCLPCLDNARPMQQATA